MSLDALRVALQGLYPLTPIAAAVQGLIAQIQEEQRQQQVAGQRGRPGATSAPDLRDGRPLTQGDDLERLVRDKWEAIERANLQLPAPDPVASAPAATPRPETPAITPGVKVVVLSPQAHRSGGQPDMSHGTNEDDVAGQALLAEQARNRRNAAAMALILAEID